MHPGDVVRGDSSGVVVVPRGRVAAAVELTRAVADRETRWRAAIAAGQSLRAATGIDALLAAHLEARRDPAPPAVGG